MNIRELRVSNFRSFKDLEIELDNFNVLVGANASGKSNFVEIFKFLRDIANHGLQNAVSMQGGIEYLRNVTMDSSRPVSLRVVCEESGRFVIHRQEMIIGIRKKQLIYEFSITATDGNAGFEIGSDSLTREYHFFELEEQNGNLDEKEEIGTGEISLSNIEGRLEYSLDLPEGLPPRIGVGDLLMFVPAKDTEEVKLPHGSLLLSSPFFGPSHTHADF
ncbi:hypothetical protein DRJ17_07275 [Candidatus Woesearchaeota archaeon]|nr:MAG: hypothetical protein DRJ17_07275 [Candidatus Woesearchaeota archaeon]